MTTQGYLSLTPLLALAVREGRKTQTMRPMLWQPEPLDFEGWEHRGDRTWAALYTAGIAYRHRAPHAPGDVLWVREGAMVVAYSPRGTRVALQYDADGTTREVPWPERLRDVALGRRIPNGCHREAARTYVRVLSVEPRRVQGITEEEAQAEGLDPAPVHGRWAGPREEGGHWSARKPFAELWDSLYRARGLGWDADPWCWMTRFERLEAPDAA